MKLIDIGKDIKDKISFQNNKIKDIKEKIPFQSNKIKVYSSLNLIIIFYVYHF